MCLPIKPEDIDVSVTGQALTMRGEIDSSKAEAEFESGVLHLTLPKAESMKPKSNEIQSYSGNRQPVIEWR